MPQQDWKLNQKSTRFVSLIRVIITPVKCFWVPRKVNTQIFTNWMIVYAMSEWLCLMKSKARKAVRQGWKITLLCWHRLKSNPLQYFAWIWGSFYSYAGKIIITRPYICYKIYPENSNYMRFLTRLSLAMVICVSFLCEWVIVWLINYSIMHHGYYYY